MEVKFTILCENDFNKEITLSQLLQSEKILKAIKSEFCEGARNLQVSSSADVNILISSEKQVYSHIIDKNDIQDILELTEEFARSQKLLKASCTRVELIDFTTI